MFDSKEYTVTNETDIDIINRMVSSFPEDDFEELEQESASEIFLSQVNNWTEANIRSFEL